MKRHTTLKSNVFSPVVGRVGQDIIYMNMSNHYRRLLAAKSSVNSNRPGCHLRPHCCCQKTSPEHLRRHKPHHLLDSSNGYEEPSPSEMMLVERIIYDDKHRPEEVYREHLTGKWHEDCNPPRPNPLRHDCIVSQSARERSKHPSVCRQSSVQRSASKKARVPSDLLDRHRESFEPGDLHRPRILKTAAQSHVRDMKVYHPPRRKLSKQKDELEWDLQMQSEEKDVGLQSYPPESSKWLQNQAEQDVPAPSLCVQCQCDVTLPQPSSKVSIASRDSAYNGGVSSGGESRGPTPEQIGSTNLANHCGATNNTQSLNRRNQSPVRSPARQPLKHYNVTGLPPQSNEKKKVLRTDRSPTRRYDTRGPAPKTTHERKSRKKKSSTHQPARPTEPSGYGRIPIHDPTMKTYRQPAVPTVSNTPRDDIRYAAFSQRITEDILAREILSSKGINAVFQRHIEENEGLLQMDLMQKEVDQLRLQLGLDKCSVSSIKELPANTNLLESSPPPADRLPRLLPEPLDAFYNSLTSVPFHSRPDSDKPELHGNPVSDRSGRVDDSLLDVWSTQPRLKSHVMSSNGADALALESTRNQFSQAGHYPLIANPSLPSRVLNSTTLENEDSSSSLRTTRDQCTQVDSESVHTYLTHVSRTSGFNAVRPEGTSLLSRDDVIGKRTADTSTQVTGSPLRIQASSPCEEQGLHIDGDLGGLPLMSGEVRASILPLSSQPFPIVSTPSALQYQNDRTAVDQHDQVNDTSLSERRVPIPPVSRTTSWESSAVTRTDAFSEHVIDPLTLKEDTDLSSQVTSSVQKIGTFIARESVKEDLDLCPGIDTNKFDDLVYASNNLVVAEDMFDKSIQTVVKSKERSKINFDFSFDPSLGSEEPQVKSESENEDELEHTSEKKSDEVAQDNIQSTLSKESIGFTGNKDFDEHEEVEQIDESGSSARTVSFSESSSGSSGEEIASELRDQIKKFLAFPQKTEADLPRNSLTGKRTANKEDQAAYGSRRNSSQFD